MSINERPNYAKTETRVEGTNMFDSILNSYKASTQGLLDTTKQLGAIIDNWNPSNSGGSGGTNSDGNTGGTGSSTTGLTPEQFQALLEQFGKIKTEGEGSGAMDFATYLRLYGSDTQKNFEQAMEAARANYGKSVKAANDAYYRSLMTYGQNAEALSAGGLTGAGVSNYGDHAAYAARQGAVATAGAVQQQAVATAGAAKQQADVANERAYFEYLQDYKANEEAKVTAKNEARANAFASVLGSGIMDPEIIKTQLALTGVFSEEELDGVSGMLAGFASTNLSEVENSANAEAIQTATEWYRNAITGGMTPEAAKLQLNQIYGEDIANTVVGNVNAVNNTDIVTQINNLNGTGFLSDAKTTLDAAKNAGIIKDDAEYNDLLTKIQTNNYTYLDNIFKYARDEYWVLDAASALEIPVDESMDDEDVALAVIDAAKARVVQMYRSGDLSANGASDLLVSSFNADFKSIWGEGTYGENTPTGTKIENTFNALLTAKEDSKKLGLDQYYEDALEAFLSYWTVEDNGDYLIFRANENPQRDFSVGKGKLDRKSNKNERGEDVIRLPVASGGETSVVLKGDLPEVFLDLYDYLIKTDRAKTN